MLYRIVIYCTFLSYFSSSCYAQDYIYQHYNVRDGLPSPIIHALFQDKQGFLWIGTSSGLCRYDGNRITVFTVKDGLPRNKVDDLFEDSKGRIWISQVVNTIAYIKGGKIYNEQTDTILKKIKLNSAPYGIVEDRAGNIFISDDIRLYIISGKDNSVKTIFHESNGIVVIQSLYIDSNGKIIVKAQNLDPINPLLSLYELKDEKLVYIKTLYDFKQGTDTALAGSISHPNYNVVSFFSGKSLIFLRDTVIKVNPPIGNTYIFSAISDSVFCFNTIEGAFLFNIHSRKYTRLLPGLQVNRVIKDRENNLWIGTATEGLYKISSQAIQYRSIGTNQDDINYITKEDDRIIAGNSNKEVFELNKNGEIKKISPAGMRDFSARVGYHEKIGANKYFMSHSIGFTIYENDVIKNEFKTNVARVNPFDKDHVLAATHYGVFIVNKNDISGEEIWNRKSTTAFATNDSIIIGAFTGLYILKKRGDRYAICDSLLPYATIRHIKKTPDNTIWLCSISHGLFCMKDGKITRHFSERSGLPSDNCGSLFINKNDVWLGTDKGLVKITKENDSFHLKKISTSDGLVSDIINAIYVDSNTIYLGTPDGICHFDETKIETGSICNLVLTGVSIKDSTVEIAEKYFLHTNERISIEFSGISIRSEREMSFRYKLHGLDENWRTTKLNLLEFTTLPHGEYELEIIAINKFGLESKPLKIKFEVVRPFHKTTWFVLLMILAPVLAIILLINRRIYLHRKKQLQKLQQEIKITRLEQMALRAQMNPHFIFNCISAIQQLVIEKDTDNASRFIASFAELVRQTLDNAPELFISLNEEIKFLTNYFELERIRLEDRFSYTIHTEGLHNKEKINVPNMVIQPFVENAIKHGIRYKRNGKGMIEVLFEQKENLLRCTITDNGIGREKAQQMRKESGIHHQSQGMGITMRRIESLNALTHQKIYVDIEDLKDEDQSAAGTSVKIDFHNINYHDKDNHY